MPYRRTPLYTSGIFHVYNRTLDSRKVFSRDILTSHFIDLMKFYLSSKNYLSYSEYRILDQNQKEKLEKIITAGKYFKITIISYCLMPTHFHILLKQNIDGGISKYISDVVNAFTRFFNIKNHRSGPIFYPRFQANEITNREQLIHVSRYIHLNPYSSGLLNNPKEVFEYRYSSANEFLTATHKPPRLSRQNLEKFSLVDTLPILSEFNDNSHQYRQFVLDNAEHQKSLETIKHIRELHQ